MSCEHCQSKHNAMLMARDNADYHKDMAIEYRADLNKALAENEALKRGQEVMGATIAVALTDNERLRAELVASKELNSVYGEQTELRDKDLTELHKAAEELAYEALCVAEPSELLVSKARAALAHIKS